MWKYANGYFEVYNFVNAVGLYMGWRQQGGEANRATLVKKKESIGLGELQEKVHEESWGGGRSNRVTFGKKK